MEMIETNQLDRHRLLWRSRTVVVALLALIVVVPGRVQAQLDVVISRRKDSEQTLNRKGTIVQWKGLSLTINSDGIEREIDNDQIVDVQTNWSDDYRSGLSRVESW